jgi:hypothetical protein
MPEDPDGRKLPEQLRRTIGRAIVDDHDISGMADNLGEDRLDVRFLIVNRDGREYSHGGNPVPKP